MDVGARSPRARLLHATRCYLCVECLPLRAERPHGDRWGVRDRRSGRPRSGGRASGTRVLAPAGIGRGRRRRRPLSDTCIAACLRVRLPPLAPPPAAAEGNSPGGSVHQGKARECVGAPGHRRRTGQGGPGRRRRSAGPGRRAARATQPLDSGPRRWLHDGGRARRGARRRRWRNSCNGRASARAGASGGAEEPGVYFAISHEGRSVDPAPRFARDAARQ